MTDQPQPEKEPAQQETQPGYTYENPNEDETYVPPELDADEDDEEDAHPRD